MLQAYETRATGARFALVAGALLLAAGCSEVSITTVPPAQVEISPPSSFVRVDGSTRLTASVKSADGAVLTGRTVHWQSLHQAIAHVDEDGNVIGLAPGTATIQASAEGVTGTAAVTVTSGPAIQVTPEIVEFDGITGGANPGDRTVAIGNPGDGTLSGLSVAIAYAPGEPAGWLTAQLASGTAPTTMVLRAAQGSLPVGTYTATVQVSSGVASNSPVTVTARLNVLTPQPAIGLGTTSVSFTAAQGGPDPATQNVAITNAGGGTLSALSASVSYGDGPSGWLSAQLASTTAPTTLALRATTGALVAGTYTATVNVAAGNAQNSPRAITVTFTVGPPQPIIGVQPVTLAFTAPQGGASAPAQAVQITNTGGGTLNGLSISVTYPGGQPQNWLTTSLSGSTAPATLTVAAAPGSLTPGTYTATIGISASGAVNSPQQVSVSFEVTPPPVPGAPTGLQATTVSTSRIDLAWNAASGIVSSYRIERRKQDGAFALIATVAATTRTYEDNDLDAGTAYGYRVQACNVSGCSAYSTEASATTHDAPPLTPSTPGNVDATPVSTSEIRIAWSYDGAPVTSFELQRAPQGDPTAFLPVASTGPLARSYLDSGLQPGTTYYYRVRACNLGVCSNWSETASTTTLSVAAVPAIPGNLTAVAISTSEIRLNWSAPGGQTHYLIRRRTGGQWTHEVSVPGNTTQYIDTGLSAGTMYQYQISACSDAGCSSYSGTASARTQ